MSSSIPPLPTHFGRYEVKGELGTGAMGVVYRGHDPRLGRPVAIKVLRESQFLTPVERAQFEARFRHEAEAAGRLSHPHIVKVYDVGPAFMVMEHLEGRTLSTFVRQEPRLTVLDACQIVTRVAEAIDHAHRHGIVHRDIKPANVMVLADGGIKVMDFGVARLDSSTLTALGTVVGSVRYMSPEQMMGERVDGRADIFSLAAVAYELLTGRPPFPGRTVTEVVSRVVRGAHVPPGQVDARLPAALNEVFAEAMATAPDRRPRHAVDFATALAETARPAFSLEVRRDPLPAGDPGAPAVLLVESDPEGALVVIDGESRGRTPVSVELPLGRHELELRAPGREAVTSIAEITHADALQVFSASLPPSPPAGPMAGPLEAAITGMTPPRRVAGGPPAYPEWARLAGLEGLVALEVEIDEEGKVRGVRLQQSAGERLDQLMLEAVAGWRFTPALRDGRRSAVRFVARHAFRR